MSEDKGKEIRERFRPTFENGGLWDYYIDLERQFEDFLKYVPYLEGNKRTYSFRLASLILSIGAHIDSTFKEVAEYVDFSAKYPKLVRKITKGKPTIRDYYPLAEFYELPEREVIFKCLQNRITLTPFKDYVKKGERVTTPYWWRVYNKVKHEFSDNFQKATLQNTKDALAAAFLIHVCHIPSAVRLCEYGILQGQLRKGRKYVRVGATFGISPDIVKDSLKRNGTYPGFVETSLFIFNGWKEAKKHD
jgi:hypothetical protein